MYLEGLIVCINFGDFLATTLPRNRRHFNKLTIVTSPEDKRTRLLARKHHCNLVETTRHLEDGQFNKAKAINDGLDGCSKSDWLILLDADIALAADFRTDILNQMKLHKSQGREQNENTIYGLHRYMCWSKAEWKKFLATGTHKWKLDKKRRPSQAPAGYFQMWCPRVRTEVYPENFPAHATIHGGYHGDLAFAKQFGHCRHLPCPCLIHLATKGRAGTDHNGRTSPKW